MRHIFKALLLTAILMVGCNNSNQGSKSEKNLKASMEKGKQLYDVYCISCHMQEGQGVKNVFPPLAKSDFLMGDIPRAIHVVKYGQQGEITVNGQTYNSVMTPLGISDEEVADILNYVTNSWGNTNETLITPKQVSKIER